MPREPRKNVGESVRARLLQRSRDERADFQILLTRYALERLLYRLSQSPHRHRFVLKGAMLFATWVAAPFRPTRDLDLLGYGENSPEAIREVFREICGQPGHAITPGPIDWCGDIFFTLRARRSWSLNPGIEWLRHDPSLFRAQQPSDSRSRLGIPLVLVLIGDRART